jgi:hypothetical protein
VVQQAMQFRPVPSAAGGLLLEQPGTASRAQSGTLLCQVLTFAGDAAVA